MPERSPQSAELERLLRQAGIMDTSARRLVAELQDHYEDLCAAARERGCDRQHARAAAIQALGSPGDIVAVAAQHRELLAFSRRHPLLAELGRGIACAASVPALPVHFCADRSESILRWSASIGLAALITASLLLSMQSIVGLG